MTYPDETSRPRRMKEEQVQERGWMPVAGCTHARLRNDCFTAYPSSARNSEG